MIQPSTTLNVDIASKTKHYPIYIEMNLLERLASTLKDTAPLAKKLLLLTDQTVNKLYGEWVQHLLESGGYAVVRCVIRDGEASKSLATAERLFHEARQFGLSRQDAVVSLGGGVVGDLGGFCAATYYRGVQYIQIPTTLLAQVDSSVGGKVGINFQDIKNGIGSFYQPTCVIIDPKVLKTLDERQLAAGFAEVVKYAMIEETITGLEPEFFQFLMAHSFMWQNVVEEIIKRCLTLKVAVVQRDEQEMMKHDIRGRMCLNFGHTFAHAYEALSGYGTLLHGEAVAIGMMQATRLAVKRFMIPEEVLQSLDDMWGAYHLPKDPPDGLPMEQLISVMQRDKKNDSSETRFILPQHNLGRVALVSDVTDAEIRSLHS